jgi:hypothetical protein
MSMSPTRRAVRQDDDDGDREIAAAKRRDCCQAATATALAKAYLPSHEGRLTLTARIQRLLVYYKVGSASKM